MGGGDSGGPAAAHGGSTHAGEGAPPLPPPHAPSHKRAHPIRCSLRAQRADAANRLPPSPPPARPPADRTRRSRRASRCRGCRRWCCSKAAGRFIGSRACRARRSCARGWISSFPRFQGSGSRAGGGGGRAREGNLLLERASGRRRPGARERWVRESWYLMDIVSYCCSLRDIGRSAHPPHLIAPHEDMCARERDEEERAAPGNEIRRRSPQSAQTLAAQLHAAAASPAQGRAGRARGGAHAQSRPHAST